ncbi:MAG: hypothetical protein HY017_27565 [Betaproteobacteria bacterium]|nr:hypothetical protein [Betaproteobacteria bacterium]
MSRALNQPIENLSDPNEQMALALIAHIAPTLGPWRQGEDLREERGLIEQNEPGLSTLISVLKNKILELETRATQAIKAGDVLGLMIGGAVTVALSFKWGGVILALIGLSTMAFGYYRFSQAKKAILNEKVEKERELANKADEQKKFQQRLAAIDKELRGREGGFPKIAVATVGFPVRKARIMGFDTLVDLSAVVPSVELSTIDLSKVGSRLQTVSEDAQKLAVVPVLLAPNSEMKTSDAVERLYGEEDLLRKLVNGFVDTLSEIEDIRIRLPLVSSQSEITRRMKTAESAEVPDKGLVLLQSGVADINRIAGFVTQVNTAKTVGERVLAELKETYQALSRSCEAFSIARSASMNHLHAQLYDVLNRASWCSKRFYCPRTIQSPVYLQALLKVDIAQAHTLPFERLVERLDTDPVIASRVKEKPEVLDLLWNSYRAVVEFEPPSHTAMAGPSSGPSDLAPHVQDQYEELLKQFRISLLKTIAGSANPVLTFSSEAQLFYDVEMEEWRSDLIPYTYTTSEIQRFGQVLKVHTDVLFPLWEQLWTEKADFRKSELFRTNESVSRMAEKESEKLIEIGNQFRADMRPVRENVYLIESELKAKGDEIRQFRNTLNDLGVLSARQVQQLNDDYLTHLTMGDVSLLKRAEEFELLLAGEPKSQTERRGTVRDPIDVARAPDVLIGYSESESRTPRLPMSGSDP